MFSVLTELRDAAAARAAAITARYPDWPCRKGCDHCCRNLARPTELAAIEWQEVEAGLAQLPDNVRVQVDSRIESARAAASRPYVCPYLDPTSGACLIYAHRPVACRTYGFYVDERGTGLYCGIIGEKVEAGELAEAVWGNHSALEARLAELGPVTTSGLPPATGFPYRS